MKSIVIYYSETGNTEKVAHAIASGLGAELKRVEEVKPQDISGYDLICLGTPVYGFSPSKIVKKFIAAMPNLPGKRSATFCTVHAVGSGRTLRIMKEAIEAKGMSFIGGFYCKGVSRLVGNFGPRIFNKGRPDEEDLKRAEEFGRGLLLFKVCTSKILQVRG